MVTTKYSTLSLIELGEKLEKLGKALKNKNSRIVDINTMAIDCGVQIKPHIKRGSNVRI